MIVVQSPFDLANQAEVGSGSDQLLESTACTLAYGHWPASENARVTTSLDAVEALREKLLPRSEMALISEDKAAYWTCTIWPNGGGEGVGIATTGARAFLAAVLRAYAVTVE